MSNVNQQTPPDQPDPPEMNDELKAAHKRMLTADDQEAMQNYYKPMQPTPPVDPGIEQELVELQTSLADSNKPRQIRPAEMATAHQAIEVTPDQEVVIRGPAMIYGGEIIKK